MSAEMREVLRLFQLAHEAYQQALERQIADLRARVEHTVDSEVID